MTFLASDFANGAHAPVPGKQVWGMVLWKLLIPAAVATLLIATTVIMQSPDFPKTAKISWLLLMVLGAGVLVILAAVLSREVLACGIVFCVFADSSGPGYDPNGVRNSEGMVLLMLAVPLMVAFTMLLRRLLRVQLTHGPPPAVVRKVSHRLNRSAAATLLVVVVLPLCLLLSAMLPNIFQFFHVTGGTPATAAVNIPSVAAMDHVPAERADAILKTQTWRVSEKLNLKFFPDTLLFYGFLEIVASVALVATWFPGLRSWLGKRRPQGWSRGEILTTTLFFVMLVLWHIYWLHDHQYHGTKRIKIMDEPAWERIARTFGMDGVLFMSLCLLPASKNSVWLEALGVSWEASLWTHRWLGNACLVFVLLHILCFFKRFNELKVFPHDVFALVAYYPFSGGKIAHRYDGTDNFTMTMMYFLGYPSLLLLGVPQFFRRRNYDLFKYAHYAFAVLVPVTLIHATSGWYFLLGGIVFWLIDFSLRTVRGTLPVLQAAKAQDIGNGKGLVELSFPNEWGSGHAGGYCFVSVAAISPLQWHPYSLSNSPQDDFAKMHILCPGNDTFSDQLRVLVRSEVPFALNVDGPYGLPLELSNHTDLLLIAGGIGVTPLMSIIREIAWIKKHGPVHKLYNLQRVHLVWVARECGLFALFSGMLDELLNHASPTISNAEDRQPSFYVKLFLTGTADPDAIHCNSAVGRSLTECRPNFGAVLEEVSNGCVSRDILVKACGPDPMILSVAESVRTATSSGLKISFEAEAFVL
jgi:predicted ferric reductase